MLYVRRECVALVVAAFVTLVGCANDQTAVPDGGCDGASCADACAAVSCVDAGADALVLDDAMPADTSRDAVELVETDVSLADSGEEVSDSDLDVDSSGDVDSETNDVGSASPSLFTVCDTNADCPIPGTVCMDDFPVSHQWPGSDRVSFTASEIFGARLPEGRGICTSSCVWPGESCRFTDDSGSLAGWSCQLVAVGELVHPGIDPAWAREYPLAEPVDFETMERGQPFAAICRPSVRDSAAIPVCGECARNADCGGGTCWDPVELAGVERADGVLQGYCLPGCVNDTDCALGFSCEEVDSQSLCVPMTGTCTDCLDIDGDDYGIGRCTSANTVSAVDCDDRDPLSFYRGEDGSPDPSRCSPDSDSNCNGVNDDAELVGPGLWGSLHCLACGDPCDATVVEDVSLLNGAVVCRLSDDGLNECGSDCATGYADCNGLLADGCETSLGTDSDCTACGDSCVALESGAPVGTCSGTLDGLSQCVIAECPEGTADCNWVFADGCEMDTTSSLQNCGACESDCTDRFPRAIEACVESRCAIASCATGFADCDGVAESGCEADIRVDELNCGACGRSCNLANAVSECTATTCSIVDCLPGFEDCDGVASNGCEANLNTSLSHCGACGQACTIPGGTAVCTAGDCELARCSAGLLDCSEATAGCETDATVVGDCGACDERCTSIPAGLAACEPNGTRTRWSCACDDRRFSRQQCDGQFNRCDESVDEGCPTALGRVGVLSTSAWGVTFTGTPSPALVADQTLPGTGGLTVYRYLYGLEVDWDANAVIQLRPLWLDSIPLTGVGSGRDFPFYGPSRDLEDIYVRSSSVLGVADVNINTAALSVAGITFQLNRVLSCPRATGSPVHAFALPVAIRLFSGSGDTLISAIGFLCQTYEVRFDFAVGSDPSEWYEVVPWGTAHEYGPFGRGTRFRQQVPEYPPGQVGTPIVGILADTNYGSWPQYSGGAVREDVSVFRALRVVNTLSWGLL